MRENKDSPAFKQTTNYNASGTSNLHYEGSVKSLRERFALSGLPICVIFWIQGVRILSSKDMAIPGSFLLISLGRSSPRNFY